MADLSIEPGFCLASIAADAANLSKLAKLVEGPGARLGVMGGTFDPVHLGHIACAQRAFDELGLDAVLFMPAGRPAFKLDRAMSAAEDRLAMCALAVADCPRFTVSDIEIRRGGVTYTSDTLTVLRELLPADVVIYFIAGSDAIASLPRWNEPEKLARLARFAAVGRPGFESQDACVIENLTAAGFAVESVRGSDAPISSSEIRALVSQGRSVRHLVPAGVADYIDSRGLYRSPDALSPSGSGCMQNESR